LAKMGRVFVIPISRFSVLCVKDAMASFGQRTVSDVVARANVSEVNM
jgi:hypothetical protein